jgi:circadian clock protein KaiB
MGNLRSGAPGRSTTVLRKDKVTVDKHILKLYVTDNTSRSRRAIENLRRICAEDLHGQYEMQVVDILEHPQLAEDEKILATPTLVRQLPLPLRRLIGDLSDREKVLLGLDIQVSRVADGKGVA